MYEDYEYIDGELLSHSKKYDKNGNEMYMGECDLNKFKSVVISNNRIVYGDRLYDVVVDSPNKGGYFDYRVIIWKRTGGLDYKFYNSHCSETLKLN